VKRCVTETNVRCGPTPRLGQSTQALCASPDLALDDAYMALVLMNAQSELSPLEEGCTRWAVG
jgi:hypothetical protein